MVSRISLVALIVSASLACGQTAPEQGQPQLGHAQEQGAADLSAPLALPSTPGNGVAIKAVCAGNTGTNGACTVAGGSLSSYQQALVALEAPTPGATPPTGAPQVLSFVVPDAIGWVDSSYASASGNANTWFVAFGPSDLNFGTWFGAGEPTYVTNVAYSFSGYIAIPANALTKTFSVGSDDGFAMFINNGSQIVSFGSGTRAFAPTLQAITFPSAGLYPFEIIFFNQLGPQAIELSWANGTQNTAPLGSSGSSNDGAFTLVPASSLYAPNIHASLSAANVTSPTGNVAFNNVIKYTAQISNSGPIAANNLTYTVVLPAGLSYPTQTLQSGCTSATANSVTTVTCTGISLAAGATAAYSFNATVTATSGTIAVQGVVQGLATSSDVASAVGDTQQIYVYTDDLNAGSTYNTVDTGNAPAPLIGAGGNSDDDATAITIGSPAPQQAAIAITGPSSVSATTTVAATGTSSLAVGSMVQVTFGPSTTTCTAVVQDNGNWTCPGTALPDGSYSATAAAVNSAGVTGAPSAAFTITVTAPAAPTLVSPAASAIVRTSPTVLAGTDSLAAGTSIIVTVLDSMSVKHVCTAVVQSDGTWSCEETLSSGGYSWTAAVVEAAGTSGTAAASQNFTVNTGGLTAPTMNQTASPSATGQPSLSGTANASDSGAGYSLRVYDGSTLVCTVAAPLPTAPATWSCTPGTKLADGEHSLSAVVVDASGNQSPASNADAFVVDTTAPAAPVIAQLASPTNQNKPILSGTGEAGATVSVVTSTGTAVCSATVQGNGSWSCSPSTSLADGTYSVTARQTDAAGNVSPASGSMTFTVDTTPPGKPTIVQPSTPTNVNTVSLSGTADSGTSLVVKNQAGTVVCTIASVPLNGNWSCTTSALPDGTNTLTATSTDAAGNSTASNPVSVVVDTTAPAAPVLAQTASPTSNTKPTFTGTAESGSSVSVSIGGNVVCTSVAVNGAFSCTPGTALSGPNNTYVATAIATDPAGNHSPVSNSDSFVVNTQVPAAPVLAPIPAANGAQQNATSSTQPTFTGTGTPGDLASVETQPSGTVLCSGIVDGNGNWTCTTQANEALSGNPASQVTVGAVQESPSGVTGPLGNTETITVATAAPAAPVITTQPASPTNVNTVALAGTAAAGSSLVVTDQAGTVVCTVASVPLNGSWSCTTSALPDGADTLSATATGPSGLASQPSNSVSTTVDTIAPAAPVLAQTPSPTANTSPTFTGTAEAGSTVKIYEGSNVVATCTASSSGAFSCPATAPLASSATAQSVVATATDAAGNVSGNSNVDQFIVNTTPPAVPVLNPIPSSPGAAAGYTDNTQPVLSGTGVPGDVVTVSSSAPTAAAICTATVLSNGTWSCQGSTPLIGNPATTHTFTASQTSPAGVASAASAPQSVTVSTVAPAAPTLVVPSTPSSSQTVPLSGTGTPGDTVTAQDPTGQILCTATVQMDGSWSCTTSALPDGTTTVTAVDTSPAGVSSAPSAAGSVTVITIGPLAPVLAQTPSPTNNGSPTFSGTAEPGATVTVSEGSRVLCTATANASGAFSCHSPLLSNGAHAVTATATDAAGNVSATSNTDSFTIDTTIPPAPVIAQSPAESGGQPGVTSNPYPVISGTGVAGDTVTVTANGQTLCTTVVQASGSWSCTSTVSLPGNPETTYPLSATQTSPAGNVSPPGTQTITVDTAATAAPTLDQPTTPTANREPPLTGTGTPGDTVQVLSGQTVVCTATVSAGGAWTCTPAAPLADGSYVFVAVETGPQGALSGASPARTLVVDGSETAPQVAIVSPANGASIVGAQPVITGTSTPGTTVQVTIDGAAYQAQTAADGTWVLTLPAPLADGTHTVTAQATAASGLASVKATATFQTLFQVARGGCASGGVPAPVFALLALLVCLRLRRRSRPAEAVPAARSTLPRSPTVGVATILFAVATISLLPSAARAQSNFDLETFRPAAGGDGYAGVEGARPPDSNSGEPFALKLWLDGTNKPLTTQDRFGDTHALIRQRYDGWLALQAHLFGPLSLSVQLPMLFGQNGDLTTLPTAQRGPSSFKVSIGDVRLTPRVALLRQESAGVDLALQGSVELPTGSTASLSSDDRVDGEFLGAIAHRFYFSGPGSLELIGNVYARLRPPREILDVKVGSTMGVRGGVGYWFGALSHAAPSRVFAEIDAQSYLRAGFTSGSAPSEWRVGATWCLGSGFTADVSGGTGIGNGVGAPALRGLFALGYSPASCRLSDRDGDGVPDRDDKCVDVPGSKELQGCPPPADRDHDGVPDSEDACPDEAGLRENHGCPAAHDRDGDGVPDMTDRCPDVPGPASNQGCPAPAAAPVCAPPPAPPPKELELPLVPLVEAAKPPPPDRDGDGVPDAVDNCPDQPGPAANHGCPETVKQLVVINGTKIDILEKVYFATAKADIQARSFGLLDQVAQVLNAHPELTKIEVQGHTDNVGEAKKNQVLSQERAEAVRTYLINKQVAADRLVAKGYGQSLPVVPNTSKASRERNRRVEFHVLDVKSRVIEVVEPPQK